jgi:ATP/maltotriose-dependent transcriptional regulator MalT
VNDDVEQFSSDHHHLDEAHAALARGAWAAARAWFEETLDRDEAPEALEGLAVAAWWQHDAAATFPARERAYRLFLARGDRRGAARVAAFHAIDYCSLRDEPAIANGWIQRARRLTAELDTCPEQAMIAAWEGHIALMTRGDTARARALSVEAGAIARSVGAVDWEMLALSLEGVARVFDGEIAAGMARLDEAATAAVAGEMRDLDAIGTVCCYLIFACERVRDYDRAAQWCELVKRLSSRWSERLSFALCRAHYAGVLIRQGAWARAEAELTAATGELSAIYPAMAAEGIARLAELRRLQGRPDEAAALFRQAESHPLPRLARKHVVLGRAALALDQGDPATAVDLAERFLRGEREENRIERVAGLELLIRARCARGELDAAADTLAMLRSIARAVDTSPLWAAVSLSAGVVAAAGGDLDAARRCFEDAVDRYQGSGVPYETTLARLELAGVLHRMGRIDAAEDEARGALDHLRAIGAAREVARAEALCGARAASERLPIADAAIFAGVTPREREILCLVAQGLTNKEIAARLHLSAHTVHRHLANILTKLALPSRAAAAAYAAQHDLI